MFGNLKDRFYDVQHDLSQGLRSISNKAKSANQRLARKAAFTIAEDVNINSNDQCFSCNLEAGSEIIVKFYKNWSEIHWKGIEIAEKADECDKAVMDVLKKCGSLDRVITSFHQELSFLPDIIKKIDAATESIETIHSQVDVFEELIDEYEEEAVRNIIEKRKAKETKILERYIDHLEIEYNTQADEFRKKKAMEDEETRKLERQASVERQKVYEDVFLEEMQHYIQYGSTEKPIVLTPPPTQSLADITLEEDMDLEKQLEDFLETKNEEKQTINNDKIKEDKPSMDDANASSRGEQTVEDNDQASQG